MNIRTRTVGAAAALALLYGGAALAQVPTPQRETVMNAADLVPVVPSAQPSAQGVYVTPLTLAGYNSTLPARANLLIGGDATTNLWQRATTGSSVTTTTTFGGPDRWFYWSGTATAMTVSRSSTAADLPTGYQYAFKMARTSGQTGVVQVCMGQDIESANVYQMQGQTVEFDFHAITGANFSPTSANMTAYIVYGTGTDEGAAKMAYGINAGGGGGSAWTGQANATAAVINLGGVSVAGRYAAVATIPATATEAGVALCWTPTGTASTNDYVAFDGMQLVRNSSLASLVSTTVGYNCAAGTIQCSSFDRSRLITQESLLQYRYYYEIDETAAIFPVAPCSAVDTTHTNCLVQFPVAMRAAPTLTFVSGFATPTSTTQATLGACTLTAATTVTSTVAGTLNSLVNCAATTIPAAGIASFLYSNNGSGKIKASAEM
jgi:hypothetical protein